MAGEFHSKNASVPSTLNRHRTAPSPRKISNPTTNPGKPARKITKKPSPCSKPTAASKSQPAPVRGPSFQAGTIPRWMAFPKPRSNRMPRARAFLTTAEPASADETDCRAEQGKPQRGDPALRENQIRKFTELPAGSQFAPLGKNEANVRAAAHQTPVSGSVS